MYLEFFKFKKNPFHITPDPDFLFLSPSHKETSASIFYGIEQRKGFVAVTGEVGVGKTTILRSYLEGTDPEKIRIVYIFNAALSFDKLLKQIVSELGIPVVDEASSELVDSLFRYLIEEYKNDRNVVLIIDEAQNLPVETLERLRMLSNLETSQDKLLQIILVGQPEFEDKLNLPELRQLRQRMAIRCRIDSLSSEESLAYIQHRLMRASLFHNPVFTRGALKRIVEEAHGIPRIINVLCDNALITAFGYQRNPVDERIVKEVIKDIRGKKLRGSFKWRIAWVPALVVSLGLVVLTSKSLVTYEEIPVPRTETFSGKLPVPPPPAESVKQTEQVEPADESVPAASEPAVSEAAPADGVEVQANPETRVESAAPFAHDKPESAPVEEPVPAVAETPPSGRVEVWGLVREKIPETDNENTAESALSTGVSPARDQSQKKNLPVLVVKKGDFVTKLLMAAYGRVDEDLLKNFRELNPQIANINKIKVGEEIVLPKLPNGLEPAYK
jgi:general secretion pathway protein A